jgi:hypothetical protein
MKETTSMTRNRVRAFWSPPVAKSTTEPGKVVSNTVWELCFQEGKFRKENGQKEKE